MSPARVVASQTSPPDLPELDLEIRDGRVEWRQETGPPLELRGLTLEARRGGLATRTTGNAAGELYRGDAAVCALQLSFEGWLDGGSVRGQVSDLDLAQLPRDLLAMQRALLAGKLGKRAQELLVRDNGDLSWNGLALGFRAFADYDAASGISVVVASNLTSGALDRIRTVLPKIASGEHVPPPSPLKAKAADVELKQLQSYEGLYELRPGRNLELRVIDGRVRMNDWLPIPTSSTTLFSPQDYAEIEVVFDKDGGVSRLDWTTGGQTYPMPKVDGL